MVERRRGIVTVQRALVGVAVIGTTLAAPPSAVQPFGIPKLTVVLVAGLLLAAALVVQAVDDRAVRLTWSPVIVAAGVFVAVAAATLVTSESVWRSLLGQPGRANGLFLYLACLVVLLAVVRAYYRSSVAQIAGVIVAATLGVALYAVIQMLGADPVDWAHVLRRHVVSTMGNPNFVSGFLGIGVTVSVWVAATHRMGMVWRVVAVTTAVLGVAGLVGAGAVQGILGVSAGGAFLLFVWLLDQEESIRRIGMSALSAAVGVGAAVVALGYAARGPLSGLAQQSGVRERLFMWDAAVGMIREEPLTGVGLAMYGGHWRRFQSTESMLIRSLLDTADASHSVPLEMFASGGLPLGLAYLVFVGLTGWALVATLLRTRGQERWLVAGIGGGWVAYQTQSAVSIDMVPLAVVHWVLAGAIIVASDPASRIWRPPGRTASRSRQGRSIPRTVAVVGGSVLVVGLIWMSTAPFRADRQAFEGSTLMQHEDFEGAVGSFDRATDTFPYEASHWTQAGRALFHLGRTEEALSRFERALEIEPTRFDAGINAARAATFSDRQDVAWRWYEHTLALEPQHPDFKLEAAEFALRTGRTEVAEVLLREILEVAPEDERARELLDDVG